MKEICKGTRCWWKNFAADLEFTCKMTLTQKQHRGELSILRKWSLTWSGQIISSPTWNFRPLGSFGVGFLGEVGHQIAAQLFAPCGVRAMFIQVSQTATVGPPRYLSQADVTPFIFRIWKVMVESWRLFRPLLLGSFVFKIDFQTE